MKKILLKLEENILIALSLIMIWGSLIYYFYNLSWPAIILTLFLSGLSFYLRARFFQSKSENQEKTPILPQKNWLHTWWPIAIYLVIISATFYLLIKSSSSSALISPWQVVPQSFFWLYLSATAWLFYVLNRQLKSNLKIWLLRIHYFLAFAIAVIVYQIGYGFDPFIHQATMELIDKQGFVLPKPLYYLGEYSLIIIFHKFSGLSIYLLNKMLVPLLSALFLPKAIFSFLEKHGAPKRAAISILILLALPLNLFILSTPQNLTYLWLLLVIFYSFASHLSYLPLILGLATLSVHPLSGLPALFFIAWHELLKRKEKLKTFWWHTDNIIIWILSAISLPLSFTLVTGESWRNLSFSIKGLVSILNFNFSSTNLGGLVLNFCYLLASNWLYIFIIFSLFGFYIWFKKNYDEAYLLVKMGTALLVGFLLSASLSFTFLIDYERNNYISRLPILISLFVLPSVVLAVDYLSTKIWRATKTEIISGWLLFSLLISASIYLSYPRLDIYNNSRGYSVSWADILAVKSIDKQTKNPYIVLANQQTSVGALKELGFSHYFEKSGESIFFYPIPTGGQLYQYYLEMVNDSPQRKTMEKAMDLAGVKEAYFAVSKYWWLSNRIISEAKITANSYWEVDGGSIYVFKFIR
ncbi:MAG: hypothetical protein WCK59_04470 [Candidatus Falkowbacteria bacterium]